MFFYFQKFKCRNINAIGAPLQSSNSTAIIIDNTIVDNIENETRISSSLALIDSNNERVLPLVTNYCKIDSRSWKSCRYCRFQRCLSCGLKPSKMIFVYQYARCAPETSVWGTKLSSGQILPYILV